MVAILFLYMHNSLFCACSDGLLKQVILHEFLRSVLEYIPILLSLQSFMEYSYLRV